jgi:hypothetical protein
MGMEKKTEKQGMIKPGFNAVLRSINAKLRFMSERILYLMVVSPIFFGIVIPLCI